MDPFTLVVVAIVLGGISTAATGTWSAFVLARFVRNRIQAARLRKKK